MADDCNAMGLSGQLAKPLHLRRLERSLDVKPFLSYVENIFNTPLGEDDNSSDSESETQLTENEESKGDKIINGITTTKEERRSDRIRLYNFSSVKKSRRWLRDVLISDTSDSSDSEGDDKPITEHDVQEMLRHHVLKKRLRSRYYTNSENSQYLYYGAGLLSNYDKYPEHQKLVVGSKRKRKEKKSEKMERKIKRMRKSTMKEKRHIEENQEHENLDDFEFEEGLLNLKEEDDPDYYLETPSTTKLTRGRRKSQQAKNPELMAIRRRKIWMMMSKKELGKVQRSKTNNHKEMLTSCKRIAQYCMKHWRQKAMQSQKNMKETVWRAKRLTREMQAYWKRYDRVERETRRRQEKEAEEQRKLDGELMEAKRQQRKLNFLITQTELYAHFMSRKLGGANPQEQLRILSQLEEEKIPRLASIDDYDGEIMKQKCKKNVRDAFQAEQVRTRQFAHGVAHELAEDFKLTETSISADEERPQPNIFRGKLKHYQLKGMNWLANLYDQGINGILADEMGLGKTVQSIAFLCHIAEKYDVWGPFLIISPASTLHNWQQEMARFVPDFKVVPYWGSPQERKILRQFWDQKDLHTKEASFHVVITSYQLVITDFKYFNRIKWQYLVLDEAQALKSTSSVRWKLLLGFSCRNRLLLSGTPIQNSMAELWALLHFIMPTLFDSHDEFNEWFSKDIESHAENKTGIDEKHLSRLHMILKPFMLRRIKKDVENELSDKIEVMVYCPLTTRQKLLYSAEYIHRSLFPLSSTGPLLESCFSFTRLCNICPMELQKLTLGGLTSTLLWLNKRVMEDIPYYHRVMWWDCISVCRLLLVSASGALSPAAVQTSTVLAQLIFTAVSSRHNTIYSHLDHVIHAMAETVEHRILRSRKVHRSLPGGAGIVKDEPESLITSPGKVLGSVGSPKIRSPNFTKELKSPSKIGEEENSSPVASRGGKCPILPEFLHVPRPPKVWECEPTDLPSFLHYTCPKKSRLECSSSSTLS
ncbi:Putative DNA helicase Ino80 [Gryllus bimaculatus]|nr:Putative DNA helicase Ino80 [Gryllus bimaculatus]